MLRGVNLGNAMIQWKFAVFRGTAREEAPAHGVGSFLPDLTVARGETRPTPPGC